MYLTLRVQKNYILRLESQPIHENVIIILKRILSSKIVIYIIKTWNKNNDDDENTIQMVIIPFLITWITKIYCSDLFRSLSLFLPMIFLSNYCKRQMGTNVFLPYTTTSIPDLSYGILPQKFRLWLAYTYKYVNIASVLAILIKSGAEARWSMIWPLLA